MWLISLIQRSISSFKLWLVVGMLTQTLDFKKPQRNKFDGVKSPKQQITPPGNDSCSNWIISRASSYWNHMPFTSISCNFGTKKLNDHVAIASTIKRYCRTSCIFENEWSDDAWNPKSAPNKWHVVDAFVYQQSLVVSFQRTLFAVRCHYFLKARSAMSRCIFFGLATLYRTNGAKFNSSVNFETPFIIGKD